MPPTRATLEELDDTLCHMSCQNDKRKAVATWMHREYSLASSATLYDHATRSTVRPRSTVPDTEFYGTPQWDALLARHCLSQEEVIEATLLKASNELPRFVPRTVPCAYVDLSKGEECRSAGTQLCGQCRLVKYCSKTCRQKHSRAHSQDCKNEIRSKKWQPVWVREGRTPIFVGEGVIREHHLGLGLQLWGTMPAIDILKLAPSKSKSEAEMNLAFIASGDLRNVMETVNGLPQDFAGTLKVVMNDRDVYVTLRNIIMLEILARTPNKRRAADIVLHLWYSAFLPDEYDVEITAIGMDLATATGALHVELGSNAALDADISDELRALCSLLLVFSRGYGADHAMQELTRVRFNSDRVDFRHRQWLRCEPSHRLALLEYTKYGLVLPFGAHKAHFKNPNRFLFSPNGVWLQSDGVNPLDSWDIEEVVASGMAHGATRDDLYGCLYYHVAGQLQKFASRLARMRISFNITNLDALELAKSMWRNDLADIGIPAKIRFDRIDVSNLFDEDYLGVARVLDAWGGFIRRGTGGGVIVGHMINWIGREPSARTTDVNDRLFEKLLRRLPLPKMRKNPSVDEIRVLQGMLVAMAHGVATAQDHSKAFEVHLSKQRISHALLRAELKRRAVHEIVPHRLCAPLSAAPAALPDLENDEAWYLRVHVASPMWTERYLEIVPT